MTALTNCPFCLRIAAQEWEPTTDPYVVMFTPLNPVTPGHMLFVPVKHDASAAAAPYNAAKAFQAAAQYVKLYVPEANIITSVGQAATQTVMHTHIHVVPRQRGDGLVLPWTSQHLSSRG